MPNTNPKGDLAVFKVCMAASKKGILVSKPLSDSARYDLILDIAGKLLRVQVKYADGIVSGVEGSVRACLEKRYDDGRVITYDESNVDLILVYIPKINRICAFLPEIFAGKKNLYIRYLPAKNGQKKGCLFAGDYFW